MLTLLKDFKLSALGVILFVIPFICIQRAVCQTTVLIYLIILQSMRVLLTVVGYFTSNLIVLKSLQSGRVIYDVRCKYRNRIILVQLDKPNRPLYNNTSYYFYSQFYPSQVLRISLIQLRFTPGDVRARTIVQMYSCTRP